MEKRIVQLQSLDKILIVIEAPQHFSMQFQWRILFLIEYRIASV